MKIMKITVLLILSLFILSSCSQAGENNQSDTDQSVEDGIVSSIGAGTADSTAEKTEQDAFDGMTSPREIIVSEEDGYFYFSDGFPSAADGSVCFSIETEHEGIVSNMIETIYKTAGKNSFIVTDIKITDNNAAVITRFDEGRKNIEEIHINIGIGTIEIADTLSFIYENHEAYSNVKRIIINDAVINTEHNNDQFLYATVISACGHKITLDNEYSLYGNVNHYVHQTADLFAINFNEEKGPMHIFTKEEYVVIQPNKIDRENDPEFYNVSRYYYKVDDTGRLTYNRMPYKYVSDVTGEKIVIYCHGFDELFSENGYIRIEKGNIVYIPENKTTVAESPYQLDILFDLYQDWIQKITGFTDLDDLLEYNKAHYVPYT